MERIRVTVKNRAGLLGEILKGAIALDRRIDLVPEAEHQRTPVHVLVVEAGSEIEELGSTVPPLRILGIDRRADELRLFEMRPLGVARSANDLGSAIWALARGTSHQTSLLGRIGAALRAPRH